VTNKGTFTVDLKPGCAPLTVNNFVFLANQHFYDGLTWHRYVPGFVIQGGDPTGTGAGGPGYSLWFEPPKAAYTLGTVSMAKGQYQSGSQIFISVVDNTRALTPDYNLFGVVSSGMDVVLQLRQGDVMQKVTVQ
jgi:cyclophilin family peptidyl-prolyl cis-trans isomerase